MGKLTRVGDLEIDQDLEYERRTSRVQRTGWVVMLLLVLGALAGLFGGGGPLATARVSSANLRLDYERFARRGTAASLRFEVAPAGVTGSEAQLWLDREFIEGIEVRSVTPEPDRVSARGDEIWFTFTVRDPSRPTRITFDLQPRARGLRRGRAGTPTGEALAFTQFIYP